MARMTEPADLSGAFQTAWNTHDMAAFGDLFHKGATFVNRFAPYVRGADKIVALHSHDRSGGLEELTSRPSAKRT